MPVPRASVLKWWVEIRDMPSCDHWPCLVWHSLKTQFKSFTVLNFVNPLPELVPSRTSEASWEASWMHAILPIQGYGTESIANSLLWCCFWQVVGSWPFATCLEISHLSDLFQLSNLIARWCSTAEAAFSGSLCDYYGIRREDFFQNNEAQFGDHRTTKF
jgi:hypothetical protein